MDILTKNYLKIFPILNSSSLQAMAAVMNLIFSSQSLTLVLEILNPIKESMQGKCFTTF